MDNKAVLVTGASRRIGRALARALAEKGHAVGVHFQSSKAEAEKLVGEIEAEGGKAVALGADLAVEAEVSALIARLEDALGEPVCVINNASSFVFDDAQSFSYAALDRQMHINLAAGVVLARDLFRRRSEIKDEAANASVINLLDQKLFNPNPDYLSYTLSKAALESATTLLAMALAPWVRVVGIAPGITLPSPGQSAEGFARAHSATPLNRSSTPSDIVAAVLFAIDNRALTGTTLLVDGGQHLVKSARDVMFHAP